MKNTYLTLSKFVVALSLVVIGHAGFIADANAQRIKEITDVAGHRPNQLVGYGLVVGLDGTGDITAQTPFTVQSIRQMLSALGVTIPDTPGYNNQTWLRNIAAVMVTAELPAYPKPGQKIDITVSAMGSSRSLKGGTLLMTPLRAADGQVYAQAQGSLVITGYGYANLNARQNNHLSAGRVPGGALVEREVPIEQPTEFVQLNLKNGDYSLMQRTAEAIVRRFGAGTVLPLDGRSMNVRVPSNPVERLSFMAQLQELDVVPLPESAKVVINSRTGSVVMNQSVRLGAFAAAHGNLSVRVETKVDQSRVVLQPPPFSGQPTTASAVDNINIERGSQNAVKFSGPSISLEAVVKALNLLGATPQDLIAILQAMKVSGRTKSGARGYLMSTISNTVAANKNSSLWDLGSNVAANSAKTNAMSEREKIAEAARGFETTLVRQMLREIHNSPFNPNKELKRDGYLEMVDDQMAAMITRGDGLGFAKKMTEQLLNQTQIAKQINTKN